MKKINLALMGLISFLSFIFGLVESDVGKFTEGSQMITWYDPFWFTGAFAIPAILGWLAHKEHSN